MKRERMNGFHRGKTSWNTYENFKDHHEYLKGSPYIVYTVVLLWSISLRGHGFKENLFWYDTIIEEKNEKF